LLDEKLTLFPGLALVRNVDYCGDDADVAPVFGSELAGRPVDCTKIPVDANRELVGQLAANLMRWRCRANPRFRLYRRAVSWLPQRVERKIYSTIVGRRLQRIGRDAGSSRWRFSGVND
jgi:hypothetical protein